MSCPLYVADQSERNYPAGNPKHCGACVTNLRDTKGTPEWPANFGQTCTTTEHSALFLIRSHTGTLSLSCALSSQPTIRGISSSGFPGAAFVRGKTIHALPLSDPKEWWWFASQSRGMSLTYRRISFSETWRTTGRDCSFSVCYQIHTRHGPRMTHFFPVRRGDCSFFLAAK